MPPPPIPLVGSDAFPPSPACPAMPYFGAPIKFTSGVQPSVTKCKTITDSGAGAGGSSGCGCGCGCSSGSGGTPAPSPPDPSPLSPYNEVSTCTSVDAPPQVFPSFHSNGGGDALDNAAKANLLVSRYAPSPSVPVPGGSVGASFRVNPQAGNLVVQMAPPAGCTMDPVPLFTYNSGALVASPLGTGWLGTFRRRRGSCLTRRASALWPARAWSSCTGSRQRCPAGAIHPARPRTWST